MNLATSARWEQAGFDAALKQKLAKLNAEKVPAAINKTGFFVALGAMKETPKKEPYAIAADVAKTVTVHNKRGQTATIPVLWAMAAKRVGKTWAEKRMTRGLNRKRATSAGKAYLKALVKKSAVILGSRKRSSGFLRVGFLSVVRRLAPFVRNKAGAPYFKDGSKIVGVLKGDAVPASAGNLVCSITSSAQAKSDRQNGLMRLAGPALARAMAAEGRQIIEHLKQETDPVLNGKI